MATKYKLICIDLDGTLLGLKGSLSQYNIDAVKKASDEGAIVCVASGRPYCQLVTYTTMLGLKTPVVACNGAHIYDPEKDEFWHRYDLPVEESLKILRFCDEHGFEWHMPGHDFMNSPFDWVQFPLMDGGLKAMYTDLGLEIPEINVVKTEEQYRAALERGCGKISMKLSAEGVKIIEEYYKTPRPGTVCKKGGSMLMETTHEKASKWDAIVEIADRYGIPHDQICVFGDNMNDLEMITNCQNSFAMSNGDERIFPYATHLAPPNTEDGVGKAIEEYILGNIVK